MSAPRIVALVSDTQRALVARLAAERSGGMAGMGAAAIVFTASGEELARGVTSESLVVLDGSRLPELAAAHLARHNATIPAGAMVDGWLAALPAATRVAFGEALRMPRAWSVKRVAHAAGISARQLVRQCHGAGWPVDPRDLLLAARLAAARNALHSLRRPTLAAVATACGWIDARSLRAALRRAALPGLPALAALPSHTTVSDLVQRLGAPNE